MNISLPETLNSFVNSQVSEGGYTSANECVRELLRKKQDRVRLRRLILDGIGSELLPETVDGQYFDRLRKRISEKSMILSI